MVEIGIKILLDQFCENIDIGLQQFHSGLVTVCFGDLHDAFAQIFAQIDRARDGLAALPVLRAGQEFLAERLCLIDLLQRQRFAVTAVNDIVVHFKIDVLLEVLVELGGSDDIRGDNGILMVMQQQNCQRCHQNHADKQQHAPQQPPQPSVQRRMRLISLHARLRFPRGSCSVCSPAFF